jgi:hypothetical protein
MKSLVRPASTLNLAGCSGVPAALPASFRPEVEIGGRTTRVLAEQTAAVRAWGRPADEEVSLGEPPRRMAMLAGPVWCSAWWAVRRRSGSSVWSA